LILLSIAYVLVAVIEWDYLRKYTKKPRTKRLVYGTIIVSYLYNVAGHYTKDILPSPDSVLTKIFGPIQKILTG
jgi:hypothetical protein